jgi:hypothetical protein
VQAAPGDVQGDAAAPGKSLTNLAGPSAATGLKSGCDGKTLADYKKAQADKLRGKDADQSKERQEIEAKYADKLTEAQQNLDAKVPPQKPWETEADYNARVDKNPSAKKAFQDANTSADAWYADQVKKLGTREAQAAKLKQGIAESDKASETKLRGQIRDRIESLRTDFGKSGTDVSENEVPAEMARKYVKPESWANQLDKGDVDAFFASQFSPSQRGSKSGEESGLYKQNLEWCFSGQVRVENDGSDTERCVGRLLGAYLSDRAAGRGRAGPPAKKTTADDRRKAINRKQRCVELGLPETCSDDDIKAKSGN